MATTNMSKNREDKRDGDGNVQKLFQHGKGTKIHINNRLGQVVSPASSR